MPDPIEALVQDWKANPSASKTIALCDALRGRPLGPLVQQVGDFATQRLGDDAAVLLSVARMYVDVQRYGEAQQVLVAAGKVAPRDAAVYKLLGEVLLRRGDASRAEKVLQRAIQLGAHDEDTSLWLEHAIAFKPLQTAGGTKAVAAEARAKQRPPPGPQREAPRLDERDHDGGDPETGQEASRGGGCRLCAGRRHRGGLGRRARSDPRPPPLADEPPLRPQRRDWSRATQTS